MAITGTKSFTAGAVLTAADVNQYLMRGIKVFADAATRTAAYGGAGQPTLAEGEASYLLDTNQVSVYTGSAWIQVAGSYDTIASASSIAVTNRGIYLLTGTTTVATITGGTAGQTVTLVASGQSAGVCVILTHGTGANAISLRDSANLGIYAGESVTVVYDGSKWVEVARNLRTVIDYVQITSNKSVTATTEATADTVVTSSTITMDGATAIEVQAFSPVVTRGTSWIKGAFYDSISGGAAASIGFFASTNGPSTDAVTTWRRRYTPSAATHAYSLRAWVDAGSGTVYAAGGGSGANMPCYIQISRAI